MIIFLTGFCVTELTNVFSIGIYDPVTGERISCWKNFTTETRIKTFGKEPNFTLVNWLRIRENKLKEYNATYDGDMIHFDTEQDAVKFLLRWA